MKEEAMDISQKSGLTFIKEIAVSDFHYGLILAKQNG